MWSFMFANAQINRLDLNKLDRQAVQIKSDIIDQDRGADALRMDLCRMMLIVESMKNLLVEKGVMTEQEFEEGVINLDLEDGVRDGVRTQKKVPRMHCSQCGKINRKRAWCYYCGQPLHVKEAVPRNKKVCPKCEQINTPRATKCLYCGEKLGAQAQARRTRARSSR